MARWLNLKTKQGERHGSPPGVLVLIMSCPPIGVVRYMDLAHWALELPASPACLPG